MATTKMVQFPFQARHWESDGVIGGVMACIGGVSTSLGAAFYKMACIGGVMACIIYPYWDALTLTLSEIEEENEEEEE